VRELYGQVHSNVVGIVVRIVGRGIVEDVAVAVAGNTAYVAGEISDYAVADREVDEDHVIKFGLVSGGETGDRVQVAITIGDMGLRLL